MLLRDAPISRIRESNIRDQDVFRLLNLLPETY